MKFLVLILLLFSCKQVNSKVEQFESRTNKKSNGYTQEDAPEISLSIQNLPAASDSKSLHQMTVSGANVSSYAFKYGSDSTIDCSINNGYTTFRVSEPAIIDLSRFGSGNYRLCMVGHARGNTWQPYSDAFIHEWYFEKTSSTGNAAPITRAPRPIECRDMLPPPNPDGVTHSCQQQKEWQKCNRDWMQGYCNKTCGRC